MRPKRKIQQQDLNALRLIMPSESTMNGGFPQPTTSPQHDLPCPPGFTLKARFQTSDILDRGNDFERFLDSHAKFQMPSTSGEFGRRQESGEIHYWSLAVFIVELLPDMPE